MKRSGLPKRLFEAESDPGYYPAVRRTKRTGHEIRLIPAATDRFSSYKQRSICFYSPRTDEESEFFVMDTKDAHSSVVNEDGLDSRGLRQAIRAKFFIRVRICPPRFRRSLHNFRRIREAKLS
jgi:hypothetical protein